MRIISLICRLLLGLVFVVFGANAFLHFIKMPPPAQDLAGQFTTVLMASHYMMFVAALQVVGGLLLLIGRYVPLGLTLLAPIVVNILLFHALMAPQGLPLAVITTILWAVTAWSVRGAFAGILSARAPLTT